ncbi:MAG: SGNH/GDSL hydrolase family protein [Pseudomonadaceae bacterium]|nr:SGNH/GDSL hydrolase family protein [Pseudomonadaceae bacterium]
MKKLLITNLLVLAVLVGLCEAVAYVWLQKVEPQELVYGSDTFLQKVYGENWQDYKQLMAEQGRNLYYKPFVEYAERPVDGRFMNVTGQHVRANRDEQPELVGGKGTVYVFGGSTTFGYGVKDNETIPAALERALSGKYKVFNLGAGGYYSTIERIRFLNLLAEGFVPEVAVFVDGLNDFYHTQVPDESWLSPQIAKTLEFDPLWWLRGQVMEMARFSSSARFLVKLVRGQQDEEVALPDAAPADKLERVTTRLTHNRVTLAGVCKAYGIRCLFVQQPVPTYHYDGSRTLAPAKYVRLNVGQHVNSGKGYEMMAARRAELDREVPTLWLQDLAIDGPMYVDTVHYTPAFNAVIAAEIAKAIR